MRGINFLWFWKVCFDDAHPGTVILSAFIPLVPIFYIAELLHCAVDVNPHKVLTLLSSSLTWFITGLVLKPIIGSLPMPDVCDSQIAGVSLRIAIAVSFSVITIFCAIKKTGSWLHAIAWISALVLTLVAEIVLHYLSVLDAFISLIPGALFGVLEIFVEKRFIGEIDVIKAELLNNEMIKND